MLVHRHLDDELTELRNLLIDMLNLVDEQLADAINAVSTCNLEQAERVRIRENEVDAYELRIDEQCERILALHNPVAVDLRLLIAAVKVNTDLERIGDHAKNLAKKAPFVAGCIDEFKLTPIREMADLSRTILHEAQDAFVKRDRVLARKVLAHDRQVDRLHDQVLAAIAEILRAQPEKAADLIHVIMMSKDIERIADHAKNMAERVVFLVEGIDIRHRKLQPNDSAAAQGS